MQNVQNVIHPLMYWNGLFKSVVMCPVSSEWKYPTCKTFSQLSHSNPAGHHPASPLHWNPRTLSDKCCMYFHFHGPCVKGVCSYTLQVQSCLFSCFHDLPVSPLEKYVARFQTLGKAPPAVGSHLVTYSNALKCSWFDELITVILTVFTVHTSHLLR